MQLPIALLALLSAPSAEALRPQPSSLVAVAAEQTPSGDAPPAPPANPAEKKKPRPKPQPQPKPEPQPKPDSDPCPTCGMG